MSNVEHMGGHHKHTTHNREFPNTAAAVGGAIDNDPGAAGAAADTAAAAAAVADPLPFTSSGPTRARNSSLNARCTSAVVWLQLISCVNTGKKRPSSASKVA